VNPRVLERVKELRQILFGFRPARVLLTANNYGIFDHLSKPLPVKTISKKINTDLRATEILLDALASIGLVEKKNNRYSNARIASQFLVSKSPFYQGDIVRHSDNLWNNWSGLDHVLKSGKPYHTERNREAFVFGMHNIAFLKAQDIVKMIGLKGVKTALDLGGGPGTYAIEMAKRGVSVTLFDSPETIEIARKFARRERSRPIRFMSGDFMIDDIGRGYDLILISQILHAYSVKDNVHVLRKCRNSLSVGGRVVVQEFPISNDRIYPVHSALFSVNMLVNTEGGRCYSSEEIRGWLQKVGLKDINEQMSDDDTVIISGSYSR
jgi:ubiquinone/menaquinone biosynthesis C-methylase UbiE